MRKTPGRKRRLADGTRVYDVSWRDSRGTKRSRTFYTGDAARAFQAQKTLARRQRRDMLDDVTFGEFARRHAAFCAMSQRERTKREIETCLRVHLLPRFGELLLSEISRDAVEGFLLELRERKNPETGEARYRPVTLRNILKRLNFFLNAAVDRRILASNPATRLSKLFKPASDAPEVERSMNERDLLTLLQCLKEVHPHCYPLFLLMARTGLRPSEAVALEWSALELERGFLVVRQSLGPGPAYEVQRTKTKKSDHRVVDMSEQLIRVMREWRTSSLRVAMAAGERSDFVFPDHRGKHASYVMKKVLEKAGLPRHYNPMSLRHSFARLSLEKGIRLEVLQRMMGHEDPSVTAAVYGRWARLSGGEAVNRLDQSELDEAKGAVIPFVR